ncbi:MAG: hypothetical protein ACI4XS_01890, partial [Bacillus sp. (in: firmicutes)]
LPVTQEIAGSIPVGTAIFLLTTKPCFVFFIVQNEIRFGIHLFNRRKKGKLHIISALEMLFLRLF